MKINIKQNVVISKEIWMKTNDEIKQVSCEEDVDVNSKLNKNV